MCIAEPSKSLSTERSDFAVEELAQIICRGDLRSPVLRICSNFRIVGAGVLDSPIFLYL